MERKSGGLLLLADPHALGSQGAEELQGAAFQGSGVETVLEDSSASFLSIKAIGSVYIALVRGRGLKKKGGDAPNLHKRT